MTSPMECLIPLVFPFPDKLPVPFVQSCAWTERTAKGSKIKHSNSTMKQTK